MGFFSRKPKKTAQNNAAKTASSNNILAPSTPDKKEVPTTPETTKGEDSPDAAAPPNPTSIPVESETETAGILESRVEDDKTPVANRSKKKHRTRISVTTPEKSDKDTSDWGATGEDQDRNTPTSTQDLDELEMSVDKSTDDIDTFGEAAANESGVYSTFGIDDNGENFDNSQDDEKIPREDAVNKNLLSSFEGCDILPDALKAMLPGSWQQAGSATAGEDATVVEEPPKKMSYYSEEFATSFLQVSFVI